VWAWAHVGRPKPAQKDKVLADALKLGWVEKECFPEAQDRCEPAARTHDANIVSDRDGDQTGRWLPCP